MNRIAIISLTLLMSACASETYITDAKSEGYREEFPAQTIVQPITDSTSEIVEENVQREVVMMKQPEEKQVVKLEPKTEEKPVKVVTPIVPVKKDPSVQRYGYTVQVVAVGTQAKVDQFARRLPQDQQPIWENYKVVNGTKWYSILYGDYASKAEAQRSIVSLPAEFQNLKPFVKSIDSIKQSEYPSLNKLN